MATAGSGKRAGRSVVVAALVLALACAFSLCLAIQRAQEPAAQSAVVAGDASVASGDAASSSGATGSGDLSDEPAEAVPDGTPEPDAEQPEGDVLAENAYDPDDEEPRRLEGVVLVSVPAGVTADEVNERLAGLDFIATKQVAADDVDAGLVELALADGVGVDEAVEALAGVDVFESVQPNYEYRIMDDGVAEAAGGLQAAIFSPQALDLQASATNDPYVKDGSLWGHEAARVYGAWKYAKAKTGTVTVAILDSGINVKHEDLAGVRVVGARYFAGDSLADEVGHGTHVAGIISATADNGKGIAGVSYGARIMPVKVTDEFGATNTLYLAQALNYVTGKAKTYNVRVVNVSIGGGGAALGEDDVLMKAIAKAHEAGLLMVYAAGNRDPSTAATESLPYYSVPCDDDLDPGAIGVMNVEKGPGGSYVRNALSNYNAGGRKTKDLCAPGTDIVGPVPWGYDSMTGTSMAAPYVSGIAALVLTANPALTAADVRNILCSTARDLGAKGFDAYYGAGLVDAEAAVRAAQVARQSKSPAVPARQAIQDIAKATVTLAYGSTTYTGSAQKPAVTVKMGGKTLKQGTDYTATYANNLNAGTAKVTVKGKGAFTGSASKAFTIKKAPLSKARVELSATGFTYDSTAKAPTVTVRDIGDNASRTVTGECSVSAPKVLAGEGKVTVTAKASCTNFTGSVSRTFSVTAKGVEMLRLYNPFSGEHLYTSNARERDSLVPLGWRYEGVAWTAPTRSATPVLRLYNPYSGDHHYTTSVRERDWLVTLGWRPEGVGWYSYEGPGKKPLYRLFNPYEQVGTHHYTLSASERDWLVTLGWRYEGIAWYSL